MLLLFTIFAGSLPAAIGLIEFVNPPPFRPVGDLSQNPIYPKGIIVNVAWTPEEAGRAIVLTLW